MRTLIRAGLAGLLTLAAAPAFDSTPVQAQGRATAVGVQTVEMREVSETIPVFAEIVTSRDGAVASRVAGNVDAVHVLAGSRVKQGDLLAELNGELSGIVIAQAEAQIAEALASIATAKVRTASAQARFDRIAALKQSGSVSQRQFDDAETELSVARSQLAEAEAREQSRKAQLAEAQYRFERSKIMAPFSGVIIEVSTIPGAYIQAGSSVVRMIDIDAVEIQASVPTRYVKSLQPGQTMKASFETGEELPLNLRAVLPLEDPSTRTRSVRFTSPGLSAIGNMAVGQALTVQIPVGEARSVLSVPKDALVQGRGGWSVFVAAEGKAQPRTVQIGVALGGRYEVLSGLQEGDQVVVRGNERLRPGQSITPNEVATN
ncbi:MAG: efflux RND transporter periplasmic adaptor subunit [Pseudomonadota bacterium]